MTSFKDVLWIELRKAIRSRMPLWTAGGYLFMPVGIAFLIFIARNPDITRQLGLMSAKANLVAYSATDWSAYLTLFAQMIAAGGFIFSVFAVSWVFGRVRSRTEVIIAGVCGGLAEYFGLDPVIVRLIFVLVTLTTGIGFIVYPVLWLVMPKAGASASGPY